MLAQHWVSFSAVSRSFTMVLPSLLWYWKLLYFQLTTTSVGTYLHSNTVGGPYHPPGVVLKKIPWLWLREWYSFGILLGFLTNEERVFQLGSTHFTVLTNEHPVCTLLYTWYSVVCSICPPAVYDWHLIGPWVVVEWHWESCRLPSKQLKSDIIKSRPIK